MIRQETADHPTTYSIDELRSQCASKSTSKEDIHQENLLGRCACCRCGGKSQQQDPLDRKRQKRKDYKRRQKERQKEQKEKALRELQQIIKDIYALHTTFEESRSRIEECLDIEANRSKFYEFINFVIREEVDLIRREMGLSLAILAEEKNETAQTGLIIHILKQVERIQLASPEIEQIINLFVSIHFGDELEQPFQKNLAQMTLKFLAKNDLRQSDAFAILCARVYEEEQFQRERELLHFMNNACHLPDPGFIYQDESDSDDESELWQEEDSTGDEVKVQVEQGTPQNKRKRRKQRRRRLKQEFQSSFESILQRVSQLKINEQQRVACNISEQWLHKWSIKVSMRD